MITNGRLYILTKCSNKCFCFLLVPKEQKPHSTEKLLVFSAILIKMTKISSTTINKIHSLSANAIEKHTETISNYLKIK